MAKTQSILTPYQREVLEAVAREKYFTERYYLAGGTALAEFYPHTFPEYPVACCGDEWVS